MKDGITEFRSAVEAIGPRGRGRRYPRRLRRLALKLLAKWEATGRSRALLASRLGLAEQTLARWREQEDEAPDSGPFREVVVTPIRPRSLVLTTATGHRVEGLDVASAADLLRLLS